MTAKTISRAGYDPRFNSRTGLYEFRFWGLGESVSLRSSHPFRADDVIQVDHLGDDFVNVSVVTDLYPLVRHQLVFTMPEVPLDEADDFQFTPYGCELLLTRPVVRNGNRSYLLLVAAPDDRMSNICARHTQRRESFNFFINGGRNAPTA